MQPGICRNCGDLVPAGAKHCGNCGAPMGPVRQSVNIRLDTTTGPVSPPGPAPVAPQRSAPLPGQAPAQPWMPRPTAFPMPGRAPAPTPLAPAPPQKGRVRLSRRALLAGGAGIVLTFGGLAWLAGVQVVTSAPPPIALDTPPGETLYTYRGHRNMAVNGVAWSPDSARIASASNDATAHIWDALTGGNVLTYHGHSGAVRAIAWSPNGALVATGGDDTTVQVWDAHTGKLSVTYSGHTAAVRGIAWSPDNTRLASGDADGMLHIWNAGTATEITSYGSQTRSAKKSVLAAAWSPDGARIAWTGQDGSVQIAGANNSGQFLFSLHPAEAYVVNDVAWAPDSVRLALAGNDGIVKVWTLAESSPNTVDISAVQDILTVLTGTIPAVMSVAWSPDGAQIAAGERNGRAGVWKASSGGPLFSHRGGAAQKIITRLAWSPDGAHLASASIDGTVQVWRAR